MTILNSVKNGLNYIQNVVPIEKRNKNLVFTLVLLGLTMDNFNVAATFTTEISIQQRFNSTSTIVSWVLSAYSLTLGSFILFFGKLSDILGPHNVFLVGTTIIWICSLISACIDSSIIALIVFRAIQGVGASALVPSGFAIAANYYMDDHKKLGKAISGLIIALTASFGLGTVIGGAFDLTNIGYKSLYYFVFAFTLVINVALLFLIIPINKTMGHQNLKFSNLDFPGVFLFVTGALLMILGLTEGGANWKSPKAYIPLPVGFILALSVFIYESFFIRKFQIKHANEDVTQMTNFSQWKMKLDLLFPPECLKVPNFLVFLVGVAFYYMIFTFALTGQIQYHLFVEENSPIIAALKVFPLAVGLVLGASVYTKERYERVGVKFLLVGSSVVSLGVYIWMSFLKYDIHNAYWKFEFVPMFLLGIATNIYFNIYLNVVLINTPLHLQGAVSGIYQTFSQVPLCIANAIIASIMGSLTYASTAAEKQALHDKFKTIHYVGMGFLVVILIAVTLARRVSLGVPVESAEKNKEDLENGNLENDSTVSSESSDSVEREIDQCSSKNSGEI